MDSTSYRVYNPATGTVRESRNVIFIETPSAIPEPDLANGLEEGEFTYDDVDEMVRDIRNYSSNIDLSSSPSAGQEVRNPSVRDLFEQIKEITNRDAGINHTNSASSETAPTDNPSGDPPGGDDPRGDSLGETALLHLREGALQVQVVVLSRVVAPVIRGLVRRRTARVAPAEVPRHVVGVVLTVGEVARHLVVGVVVVRRSVLLPDR